MKKLLSKLKEEIVQCEKSASIEARSGPVTANLDTVLHSHETAMQAYHCRSFIGNHCHKYLQPHVYEEICTSVVAKTTILVTCDNITEEAHAISSKFKQLNKRFSAVHKEVSHSQLVIKEEALASDNTISSYMRFYRKKKKPKCEYYTQTVYTSGTCAPLDAQVGGGDGKIRGAR